MILSQPPGRGAAVSSRGRVARPAGGRTALRWVSAVRLSLVRCTDPDALNYRSYLVASNAAENALKKSFEDHEGDDVVIELIRTENRIPRWLARKIYYRVKSRFHDR
jgi:hypothetical protein